MARKYLPPIEFLRECFSSDPRTGEVRWRYRPDHHFMSPQRANNWNSRNAGTAAGAPSSRYGNVRVTYQGRTLRIGIHRLVFALETGSVDFGELDHADVDAGNHAFGNIRPATRSLNNANRTGWAKSGLPKGVSFVNNTFAAAISGGRGRTVYLGRFPTPSAAHAAYCAAARERFGAFFNPGPSRPSVFD